jgi:hypothetical protein
MTSSKEALIEYPVTEASVPSGAKAPMFAGFYGGAEAPPLQTEFNQRLSKGME